VSGRQLKLIFGVLTILVVTLVALRVLGGDRGAPAGSSLSLGDHVDDETALIRLLGPGDDSVRLERTRGSWTVNGYPVDSATMAETIDGLRNAGAARLVARSPDNHARMGVADETARRIEIGSPGNPDVAFLLGDSGADGRYVRIPDASEVYSIRDEAVATLDGPAIHWRDRLIAAVDTGAVSTIVVNRGGSLLTVQRTPEGWVVDGEPADGAVAAALLGTFAELKASGFPPDSVVWNYDFDAPDVTVEVFGNSGPAEPPILSLLMVSVGDGSDYVVKTARGAYVYALSEFTLRPMLVDRDILLADDNGAE